MKNIARYKKYVINTLIFSLIAAALVAVVSIIVGSFSDTSQKIIWILASVVTHALIGIALIERSEDKDSSFMMFRYQGIGERLFLKRKRDKILSFFERDENAKIARQTRAGGVTR